MERDEEQAREQAAELEDRADGLEERGERLDEQVDEVARDWEQKKDSADVPGAQDEEDTLGG